MLGLAPVAATPLSATGAAINSISELMSASIPLAFSGSAGGTALVPMTATIAFAFDGSAAGSVEQQFSAHVPLRFSGNPVLRVAGRPFRFHALPSRFRFRAITRRR